MPKKKNTVFVRSIPSEKQRKIFVLTGKRGGFGAMKPMLRLIRDDPSLQLQLVVTDQHLSDKFGKTISEVEREFFISAAVNMNQCGDSPLDRAKALGVCATKMAETLAKLSPDICVLYGDRGEVLATAMAATTLGLPIAHIQGGDLSGSVDEQVRHAVTKLAQVHFPSTQESGDRIKGMGEEEWRIHVVGDNHIDLIAAGEYSAAERVAELLNLDLSRPIVVVLQHSETTEPDESYDQMRETLTAVIGTGAQIIVIHPCSDVGYGGIIQAITDYAVGPDFRVRVNLEASDFWGLLAIASAFIGNSSAGIIETPTFRLPAINIGRRQQGRLTAENVIHLPHDASVIRKELDNILRNHAAGRGRVECSQPYGDGKAGERIVGVLKAIPLDKRLMVKRMTY